MAVRQLPTGSSVDVAELGRHLLTFTEPQLVAFCADRDPSDLAIIHEALARAGAEARQTGWRRDPYTMAAHLEGDQFQHYRFHQFLADQFRQAVTGEAPFQIWNCPAQVGKGLALDTPILTPTGWTTMGALNVGDQVFSGDGTPCTVTGVSPVRHLDCYRVELHDGATLTADGDHRWKVWDADTLPTGSHRKPGRPPAGAPRQQRRTDRGSWQVVDTRALRAGGRRYRLPACPGVTFPDRTDLPIDPYVLGAWLGDGNSDGCGFTCADDEILQHLANAGDPARRCATSPDRPYACTFAGTRRAPSTFRARLRAVGVLGAKRIPDGYLFAGDKQRLGLLQGLMDTDGHVSRRASGYSQCEFTSTNRQLADGVQFLARSLGIRAVTHEGRATLNGRDVGPKWRVTFTTDLPVFRLSRKARLLWDIPGPRRGSDRVGARAITSVPTVPTRCITVDSPDSTYLAGRDLTVTHNTALVRRAVAWALDRDPTLPIIYTSYGADLALNSARAIRDYGTDHQDQLRYRLREDATKVGEWLTTEGGGLKATGVAGALSGFPAGGLVVDDPHKNWQEAHSPAKQQQVWDLWRSVLRMRLRMGAWVVVLHTRWCFGDFTDRLLEDAKVTGEQWRHIALPMIAEHPNPEQGIPPDPLGRAPGEPLEPQRFDLAACLARARAVGSYLTSSMEQQHPAPLEGGLIKRAWWQLVDALPERWDEELTSWDVKMKDKADEGDYVVGQVWGRVGGSFYLRDSIRRQFGMAGTKAAVALLQVRYPSIRRHIMENTGNAPEVMADLNRADPNYTLTDTIADQIGATETERGLVEALIRRGMSGLIPNNPKGDKVSRVVAVSGVLEALNVYVRNAEWTAAFVGECASFRGMPGETDDQVDTMSQALGDLSAIHGPATVVTAATASVPRAKAGQGIPGRLPSRTSYGRPR